MAGVFGATLCALLIGGVIYSDKCQMFSWLLPDRPQPPLVCSLMAKPLLQTHPCWPGR